MNWARAWRIRRLERYLAAVEAEQAAFLIGQKASGYVWPHRMGEMAAEVARLRKLLEQLKDAK